MKKKQKKKRIREGSIDPEPAVVSPARQEEVRAVLPRILAAAGLIVLLAVAAYARNTVYQTPVTLWKDASSKSANKRRTHENYGQALSTAGAYNEAIREFKTVLVLKDDGSVPMRDLYREIGVVYFRVGLIDDSIKSWLTGLDYAPMDPSLLNNLSVAYLRQQRYDDAERSIRQALMGAPQMPQALNSLGEILMVKGEYQEALSCFLKAIEASPEGASRYWNAALASEKTGRIDMALDFADRYAQMETNPQLKERAFRYLAQLRTMHRMR